MHDAMTAGRDLDLLISKRFGIPVRAYSTETCSAMLILEKFARSGFHWSVTGWAENRGFSVDVEPPAAFYERSAHAEADTYAELALAICQAALQALHGESYSHQFHRWIGYKAGETRSRNKYARRIAQARAELAGTTGGS